MGDETPHFGVQCPPLGIASPARATTLPKPKRSHIYTSCIDTLCRCRRICTYIHIYIHNIQNSVSSLNIGECAMRRRTSACSAPLGYCEPRACHHTSKTESHLYILYRHTVPVPPNIYIHTYIHTQHSKQRQLAEYRRMRDETPQFGVQCPPRVFRSPRVPPLPVVDQVVPLGFYFRTAGARNSAPRTPQPIHREEGVSEIKYIPRLE